MYKCWPRKEREKERARVSEVRQDKKLHLLLLLLFFVFFPSLAFYTLDLLYSYIIIPDSISKKNISNFLIFFSDLEKKNTED
jgi:hypothetical protein